MIFGKDTRDRKNPISPNQTSLQSSFIEQKIQPIRCLEPIVLGLRQGQDANGPGPGTPFAAHLLDNSADPEVVRANVD